MLTKICANCGASFSTNKKEKTYCSRKCYFSDPNHPRRTKPKKCPTCGKMFVRRQTYSVYCSKACFDVAQTGRPNAKNSRPKIEKICAECGKHFFVVPACDYRIYCCAACFAQSKLNKPINVGPQNGQWKGGVYPENKAARERIDYKRWREAVFKRDDYTCQKCGKRGTTLHAHHLYKFSDYPELRYHVENGKTLCKRCHDALKWRERNYLVELGLDPDNPPFQLTLLPSWEAPVTDRKKRKTRHTFSR